MAATGHAKWMGNVEAGSGTVETGTKSLEGTYTAASRFADGEGTNPEEMLAAAHASCYSMALSNGLAKAGNPPTAVTTDARVTFVPGEGITLIEIAVVATVPGIDQETFSAAALDAKANCPVSQALRAVPIELVEATLA